MPRTIAIGDVHGCADEFEELLNALELEPEDRVIQVGDLINRGPNSRGAIKIARQYKVEAILGNHELRLLTARRKGKQNILKNYDLETYKVLTKEDWIFLEAMPKFLYNAMINTVIVHGGFLPNIPWQTQSLETITSIQVIDKKGKPGKRSDNPEALPWADFWGDGPFVIYGHTPRPNVLERPGSVGIDTGCVYGGHLTAYCVEDHSLMQVRAGSTYAHSSRLPVPV